LRAAQRPPGLSVAVVPERSYMRSSLAEKADAIREELSDAVVDAMR